MYSKNIFYTYIDMILKLASSAPETTLVSFTAEEISQTLFTYGILGGLITPITFLDSKVSKMGTKYHVSN